MVRKVLIFLLAIISVKGYSQIPVTDAALNATANVQTATLIKGLAEGMAQGETLIKTYKGIKEGIEVYKKVSSFIKNSRTVATLIQEQYNLLEYAGKTMQKISKMKLSKTAVVNADQAITNILGNIDRNMDMLVRILTDTQIKTDDGQRLMLVNSIVSANTENKKKLQSIDRLYTQLAYNNQLYNSIRGTQNSYEIINSDK